MTKSVKTYRAAGSNGRSSWEQERRKEPKPAAGLTGSTCFDGEERGAHDAAEGVAHLALVAAGVGRHRVDDYQQLVLRGEEVPLGRLERAAVLAPGQLGPGRAAGHALQDYRATG